MTTVESDQTNLEAENGNTQPSSQGGDKQSSQPNTSGEFVSKAEFTGMMKELSAQISGLQSDKDRAVNRNASAIDKLMEQIGRLNLDEKQQEEFSKMKTETELSELREKVESLSAGSAPASPAQQTTDEFLTIINQAAQNPNDPKVLALAQQYEGNRIGFGIALGALGAAQKSVPSPAASIQEASTGEPPPDTVKTLSEEFLRKAEEALTAGKRELYKQLKAEYRDKGVPVDRANFTVMPEY